MSYSQHKCLEFPSRNPASRPSEINDPSSTRTTAQLSAFQERKPENLFQTRGHICIPNTPRLCQKWVFLQVGPHGYSMTQNSGRQVSKRRQIPSAPLSQFTDVIFAIKNFARSQNSESSQYVWRVKCKDNLQQKLRTQ